MKKHNLKPIIISALLAVGFGATTVGTSFALFTDKAETTISVTAGKVDIGLTSPSVALFSAKADENGELVDENGAKYVHEAKTTEFTNGGTATLENNVLTIDKMTPGDKVIMNLNVSDQSNVAYKYRLKMVASKAHANDNEEDYKTLIHNLEGTLKFYSGEAESTLVKTVDISEVGFFQTDWILSTDTGIWHHMTVELGMPITAGNVAQDKSAALTYSLEAVQGNAVTEGAEKRVVVGAQMYEVVYEPNSSNYVIKKTDLTTGVTIDTNYKTTAEGTNIGLFGNSGQGILSKGDIVVLGDSDNPDAYSPGGHWVVNDGVTIKAKEGAHPVMKVKDAPLLNCNGDVTIEGIKFVYEVSGYAISPNTLNLSSSSTPTRDEKLASYKNKYTIKNCEFVGMNENISEDNNKANIVYGINLNGTKNSIEITNSTFTNFGGYSTVNKHGMVIAGWGRHDGYQSTITLKNNTFTNCYSVVDFVGGTGENLVTEVEELAWQDTNTYINVARKSRRF